MTSSLMFLQVVCVLLIYVGNCRGLGGCGFEGVFNVGDLCFLSSTTKMTWMETRSFCDHFGYESIIIEDHPNTTEVKEYLDNLQQTGEYWTGATDLLEEGAWYWEDLEEGSLLDQANSGWAPGRPLKSKKFNCLYLKYEPETFLWYDGNCRAKKFPICYDELRLGK
ncbi:hypothetical protein ScPMuIL_017257 [Solemya velum]